MNFKTITTILGKTKDSIVKHGPQVAAVAGVGFFLAGTYFAIKETPNATKKLEAKKALDKDMGRLQKAAVLAPEYKKTEACVAAGIIFTGLAWHLEAKHVATLLAALSAAKDELKISEKEKKQLVEAAKEVVGEEKTGEIVAKKEELEQNEREFTENTGFFTADDCNYLFRWPCGVELWMTWADFRRHNSNLLRKAASQHGLKLSEYFDEFGLDDKKITKYMKNTGWQPSPSAAAACEASDDWLQWAGEVVDYKHTLGEKDHYNHIAYWEIVWENDPDRWDPKRAIN